MHTKNLLILFLLFFGWNLFAQTGYEHSLQEKKHFNPTNESEKITLDTDYVPIYYRLEFNADPNVDEFSGKTTMHFNTTAATNLIKINAKENLEITEITYHSNPLTNFSRNNDIVSITLPANIPQNTLDSISIGFSGTDSGSHGYTINGQDGWGEPVAYTLSEPYHASGWWVCKDDLMDKVNKLDVYITHPTGLKAASNGVLKSVTDLGSGKTKTHWQHNYPIPSYLVALAVTNYEDYTINVNVGGTDVPIVNYIYPGTLSWAKDEIDKTPTYITKIGEKYGEYPYKNEKYGHAQWEWGGGMEHATMSFMGGFDAHLITHELAHQWTGDMVTCKTWNDIWLNEGFAEYTSGWLVQDLEGEEAFRNWKDSYIYLITSEPGGSVWNPEPDNEDRIFDYRLTYAKGSMMVHLMRYIINNDELFYQAVRNYLHDPSYQYGFATTDQFKASLEQSTGMNWDNYFQDWIYGSGHPKFNIDVTGSASSMSVKVKIQQSQSDPSVSFFETPFEITFIGSSGQQATRRFNLTQNNQEFWVDDLPFEVSGYLFNPNYDVVCEISGMTLNNVELNSVKSERIKLYPNPADQSFTIENVENIDEIKIFDVTGKVVYENVNAKKQKIQINSSNFPSGTYMTQIKSGNRVQLVKLLIK